MAEISVIVPVYNVQPYLRRCLDSVVNQTFSDLEILLIDDGSTDKSGEICDEYARADNRIRVIHKQNAGISAARNTGIDIAAGRFIGFIDSDDYIAPDMYEQLRNEIIKQNAGMAVCGVFDVYNDKPAPFHGEYKLCDSEQAMKVFLLGENYGCYAVDKLYKRELFNDLRFKQGIIIEDAQLMPKIVAECERVVFTGAAKYYYMHRNSGITGRQYYPKLFDTVDVWMENAQFIGSRYPALASLAQMRVCWAHFFVLDRMALDLKNVPQADLKRVTNHLRGNYKSIIKSELFNKMRKLAATALMINVRLYALCVKCGKKR